jgi:hypothetical protein
MSLHTRVEDSILECRAIGDLINDSFHEGVYTLTWIPSSELGEIVIAQILTDQMFYHAVRKGNDITRKDEILLLLLLGNSNKCTLEFINQFARIYSLPTHKYNDPPNLKKFRRYTTWLKNRNVMIKGFTKYNDIYYLVTDRRFHHCYSRYGFCSACEKLRCSPVWCICGCKELSDTWTSNNEKLDNFIKKLQIQTNSANDTYLEWIPFDCMKTTYNGGVWFRSDLPASYWFTLIPFDETDDSSYDEVILIYVYMNTLF